MTKIGLISDTHGYLDPKVYDYFENCDEIWHAGDIGPLSLIQELEDFKPVRAVWGNIDDKEVTSRYAEDLRFSVEGKRVWMTHIGGYPPKYNRRVKNLLTADTPDIFICGHSHILKVMTDPALDNMLFLNPGAAGQQGFHQMKTLLRFDINGKKVDNLEVIELGKRGAIKNH